jgi:hypothetical protein
MSALDRRTEELLRFVVQVVSSGHVSLPEDDERIAFARPYGLTRSLSKSLKSWGSQNYLGSVPKFLSQNVHFEWLLL